MRVPVLLLLALVPSLAAQEPPWSLERLSDRMPGAELDAITARGKELAAYDMAAWHGTDAVLALHPASDRVRSYIARRRQDGMWEVVFGRQSTGTDTFYVAYRAVQATPGDTSFAAEAFEPALADTEYYARAARALAVGGQDFGRVSRPYNSVVLPIPESGEWLVYLLPAPTRAGYWPLGADARYRVSGDGRRILAKRRLHNTIIEYGAPPPRKGAELKAGYHTAVLDDRPEDTDVFLVLTRQPRVPEYIVSQTFYFRIDLDGRITAYDRE